jgi:hypothetical protein
MHPHSRMIALDARIQTVMTPCLVCFTNTYLNLSYVHSIVIQRLRSVGPVYTSSTRFCSSQLSNMLDLHPPTTNLRLLPPLEFHSPYDENSAAAISATLSLRVVCTSPPRLHLPHCDRVKGETTTSAMTTSDVLPRSFSGRWILPELLDFRSRHGTAISREIGDSALSSVKLRLRS